MDIRVKKFNELTTTDLYDLMALRMTVFVVEQQCIYQDFDGKDKACAHLLLSLEVQLAAYLRILPSGLSYEEVSIGRVVVSPDFRKRKLGRIIMEKALEYIEEIMSESTVRISAQLYLKDFYEGLGFEACGESYLEDDIPHIEMLYQK